MTHPDDTQRTPTDAVGIAVDDALMDSVRDSSGEIDSEKYSQLISKRKEYPHLTGMGTFLEDRDYAVECGRKGGLKSGVTKRKRRLLRDAAQQILSADVSKLPFPEMEDLRLALNALGVEDITGADALLLAQYIRAAKGDTEAFRAIRDTSGEKPSVDLSVTAMDRPIDSDTVSDMSDADLAALVEGAEDQAQLPEPQMMLQ